MFRLSPTGTETVLYSFTGGGDGGNSTAGLIRDGAAGNLYGTTPCGGAYGEGVVFKLIRCSSSQSGYDFKVIHTFTGADGVYPFAGLIQDAGGNLYGTTQLGGAHNVGVVFRVTPN